MPADFRFPPHCEDLRADVRQFLAERMPTDLAAVSDPHDLTGLDEAFERELQREAGARGWLSLDPLAQAVFNFEAARADAPLIDTAMTLAGTAVAQFGSPEQKAELLARMVAGDVEMCAAYTELGAGSDLAVLTTTAHEADGVWVLDGTKVLVTGAHKAEVCVTIARTTPDVAARKGTSMFLVPMDAPGVELVRHETMNGWWLGEVRFHEARLPSSALLGERDAGWRQMATALAAERSGIFWLGFARHVLDLLAEHLRTASRAGTPLADDPVALDVLGDLEAQWAAADRLARRAAWDATSGGEDPSLPSMSKVVATELLQEIAQRATELAGAGGLVWAPLFRGADLPGAAAGGRLAWEYLERVHGTIGAGTNEVHRDAIATVGLGLPRRGR